MDSLHPSFHHAFENIKYHAKDLLSAISGCVCQQQTQLKINGRMCTYVAMHWLGTATQANHAVKIVSVLGEGGFSFVYLARDEISGVSVLSCGYCGVKPLTQNALSQKEFALKKIRCPTGAEDVEQVMREVAAYRRFKYVFSPHSTIAATHPYFRHPNIIRLYVRRMHLHDK
jgi:serine/threonine kinase 16